MKPTLFALWLAVSGLLFPVFAQSAFPNTSAWLFGLVVWALLLVPFSFALWFAARRKHEEADTAAALDSWSAHRPDAMPRLAQALDEILEEEDERSLERLLQALDTTGEEFRAERQAFAVAARNWLQDTGGRESRYARLELARECARPLVAKLRTA